MGRLKDLGAWLRKNGEGIFSTRPWVRPNDGQTYFTRSKDGAFVYIHCFTETQGSLRLPEFDPVPSSAIVMLGEPVPLRWTATDGITEVTIPEGAGRGPSAADFGFVLRVQVR